MLRLDHTGHSYTTRAARNFQVSSGRFHQCKIRMPPAQAIITMRRRGGWLDEVYLQNFIRDDRGMRIGSL
ncbi:hypothetical protein BDW71DRAFT_179103 [Aspergillus fruticulosus]